MSDGEKRVQRQVKPKLFVSQFLGRYVSHTVQRVMGPTAKCYELEIKVVQSSVPQQHPAEFSHHRKKKHFNVILPKLWQDSWNADCGVGVGGLSLLLRTFGFIFKQTEKSQELMSWCLDCKKKRPDV